jgi:hypothetical protein
MWEVKRYEFGSDDDELTLAGLEQLSTSKAAVLSVAMLDAAYRDGAKAPVVSKLVKLANDRLNFYSEIMEHGWSVWIDNAQEIAYICKRT